MPKKKEPPLSAAEQRRRFEALTQELGPKKPTDHELRKALKCVRLTKNQPKRT